MFELSKKSALRSFFHVFTLFFLAQLIGCKHAGLNKDLSVSSLKPANNGKPIISSIVDFGNMDIKEGDKLHTDFSDKRYSPGEWIMLKGKNLGVTQIKIDDIEVEVERYFGDSPIIRIPVGLSPRKKHSIQVNQKFGQTKYEFFTSHYIVVTDTDDKKIHLIRTNVKDRGGIEEEWIELKDFTRPMFNIITNDSSHLITVDIIKTADTRFFESSKSYELEIKTFDLRAPNQPQLVATRAMFIGSALSNFYLSESNKLLLLGKQSFTELDVTNPRNIEVIGRKELPASREGTETEFIDAIYIENAEKIVALETYSNRLVLLSGKKPNYSILSELSLLPKKELPFSVDLEADPSDTSNFWVLHSPNYRIVGTKFKEAYKRAFKGEKATDATRPVYQLQKMIVKNAEMLKESSIDLPRHYASYFSTFGEDGRIYVSATKMDFLTTSLTNLKTKDVIKKAKSFLWDRVAFGRIMAIDPNTEKQEFVANGVGIYYDLIDVPDIGPVFSLLKFGPSFSFPFLAPNWGLGIKSTGTYAKRRLDYKSFFPPYNAGDVDFQY